MSDKTIICYGDSNTYGFDPRGFLGGRYPAEDRWCDILAADTGYKVINFGENGRMLPEDSWDYLSLDRCVQQNAEAGLLVIMLGSNDVLLAYQPNLKRIQKKLDNSLACLKKKYPQLKLLLLAPPAVDIPAYVPIMEQLAEAYSELAQKYGVDFANPQQWGLPLAYDGVHLTQKAHHLFAERLRIQLGL